jgi:hypothetical protein
MKTNNVSTNRQRCYQIADALCCSISALSLSDLPDLPCLMNALDEMEGLIEQDSDVSVDTLRDIAHDAIFELLESEGFPF